MFQASNLYHRLNRRGYIVGPTGTGLEPIRTNLHRLPLDIIEPLGRGILRASWQRIYDQVEEEILACCPFGTYQVSEAVLCEHYKVSRTVIRDVLNRMHGGGLIEKDRWSHWIAGPLSARHLDEHFGMRKILEPAPLIVASETLTPQFLKERRDRLDSGSPDLGLQELYRLELDLLWDSELPIKTPRLSHTLIQNNLPLPLTLHSPTTISPIP